LVPSPHLRGSPSTAMLSYQNTFLRFDLPGHEEEDSPSRRRAHSDDPVSPTGKTPKSFSTPVGLDQLTELWGVMDGRDRTPQAVGSGAGPRWGMLPTPDPSQVCRSPAYGKRRDSLASTVFREPGLGSRATSQCSTQCTELAVVEVPAEAPPARLSSPKSSRKTKTRADRYSTIMLRNIPNKVKKEALMEFLDSRGFQGVYDIVYLPEDPRSGCNRGYAFINMVNNDWFKVAMHELTGLRFPGSRSQKILEVCLAKIQGKKNLLMMTQSKAREAAPRAPGK